MTNTHKWVPIPGGYVICRKCGATGRRPKDDSDTSGRIGELLEVKGEQTTKTTR